MEKYPVCPLFSLNLKKLHQKQGMRSEVRYFERYQTSQKFVFVPGQMFPPVVCTEGLLPVGAVVVGPTLRICV
jgi:hypothetical protein